MMKSAVISDDGKYRYRLFRGWGAANTQTVMWIMLNPSTADAETDDPTIRRCISFSKYWGFGSMLVGNLYAYRATDPRELARHDAAGPDNAYHLYEMSKQCSKIICAWGNPGGDAHPRLCIGPQAMWCLGKNTSGTPKHPLYLPARLLPIRYP